jgi:hypothetical protein
MVKKVALIILVALTLSVAAYGFARRRKFIAMHDTHLKEERLRARFTARDWDVRDNWRGHAKNRINPYVVTFFRPLEYLEDTFRGFRKRLDPPKHEGNQ